MSIWDALVGQDEVVAKLERAVAGAESLTIGEPGPSMTHAWLFTGPPGSGRSTAATCFGAALVCLEGGCGVCQACRNAPLGGHLDVDVIRPEGLSYSVDEARELVKRAAMSPASSHWHVVIVEDADRLTDQAVNVLLKSIEEPPPHTIWLLCAPSVEDVPPTIVSRTRHVALRTPSTAEVAKALTDRYAVDGAIAAFAARASQGHIGRARALATDEHARIRRAEVLRVPLELRDLNSCFICAANILEAASADAEAITAPLNQAEIEDLDASYGVGGSAAIKGQLKRSRDAALKDLTKRQKTRSTRTVRDQVDRVLLDLLGLYRDVLVIQLDAVVPLINEEMRPQIQQLAANSTANDTGRRLGAIDYARSQIQAGVTPLIGLESLLVEIKDPWIRAASA